jgi:hypothetical protein
MIETVVVVELAVATTVTKARSASRPPCGENVDGRPPVKIALGSVIVTWLKLATLPWPPSITQSMYSWQRWYETLYAELISVTIQAPAQIATLRYRYAS